MQSVVGVWLGAFSCDFDPPIFTVSVPDPCASFPDSVGCGTCKLAAAFSSEDCPTEDAGDYLSPSHLTRSIIIKSQRATRHVLVPQEVQRELQQQRSEHERDQEKINELEEADRELRRTQAELLARKNQELEEAAREQNTLHQKVSIRFPDYVRGSDASDPVLARPLHS